MGNKFQVAEISQFLGNSFGSLVGLVPVISPVSALLNLNRYSQAPERCPADGLSEPEQGFQAVSRTPLRGGDLPNRA